MYNEARWHPATALFSRQAPEKIRGWLRDNDSLTQQLICHCAGQFRVQVIRQYWQKPLRSESLLLNVNSEKTAFIREVFLYCREQPWVFARTIIPLATLRGELQKLTQLGSRPLGQVLWSNHAIARGDMQIARFNPGTAMYNDCQSASPEIWGRRSLFQLGNKPLLVNELFLDQIPRK